MAITFSKLYEGQPAATNTTLSTCPANTRQRVLAATVTNDGTTARYITFHLVPSGGSAGDTNIILNQKVIGSRESYNISELIGHILDPGDFISAIAEAASELTVHISGVNIT